MEHVCGKGNQGRQVRIRVREGDLEAEDGVGVWTYGKNRDNEMSVLLHTRFLPPYHQQGGLASVHLAIGLPDLGLPIVIAMELPLRTKITPDHRFGSPGVRLTKTPFGHACLRPALCDTVVISPLTLLNELPRTGPASWWLACRAWGSVWYLQLGKEMLPSNGGQVAHPGEWHGCCHWPRGNYRVTRWEC